MSKRKKMENWVDIAFKKKVVWKEKMWNKHLGLEETSWDGEWKTSWSSVPLVLEMLY